MKPDHNFVCSLLSRRTGLKGLEQQYTSTLISTARKQCLKTQPDHELMRKHVENPISKTTEIPTSLHCHGLSLSLSVGGPQKRFPITYWRLRTPEEEQHEVFGCLIAASSLNLCNRKKRTLIELGVSPLHMIKSSVGKTEQIQKQTWTQTWDFKNKQTNKQTNNIHKM